MAAARDKDVARDPRGEAKVLAEILRSILANHRALLTPAKKEVLEKLLVYLDSVPERWASTDIKRINDARRIIKDVNRIDFFFLLYTVANSLQITDSNSQLRDKVGKEAAVHLIRYLTGLAELALLYITFNSVKEGQIADSTKYLFYTFVADQLSRLAQKAVGEVSNLQEGLQDLIAKLNNISIERLPKIVISKSIEELAATFSQSSSMTSALFSYVTQKSKSVGSHVYGVVSSVPTNLLYAMIYGWRTPKPPQVEEKANIAAARAPAVHAPAASQPRAHAAGAQQSVPNLQGAIYIPPPTAAEKKVAALEDGLKVFVRSFKKYLEAIPQQAGAFRPSPYPFVTEGKSTIEKFEKKYLNGNPDAAIQQLLLILLNFKSKLPQNAQQTFKDFLSEHNFNLNDGLRIVGNTPNDNGLFHHQLDLFKHGLALLTYKDNAPAAAARQGGAAR